MEMILTCEHASNSIPRRYASLFINRQKALNSHRGWDIGAGKLATKLSQQLGARLFKAGVSRLLIDLNRSLHHSRLFSETTRKLHASERQQIIDRYYLPYRNAIETHISNCIRNKNGVIHISVHSFTPELNGKTRNCDVGLLYDPAREHEKPLAMMLHNELKKAWPDIRVRFNYPYRGTDDGLTSALRNQFTESSYVGIEFEINQQMPLHDLRMWRALQHELGNCINNVLQKQRFIK